MGKAVARHRTPPTRQRAQAIQALELRLAGVPDHEICDRLAISKATLKRRIDLALSLRLEPAVDQYRTEQLARLEGYRRRLVADLSRPSGMLLPAEGGDAIVVGPLDPVPAIRTLLGIEERTAKLLGLDAPTRLDVKVEKADAWAALEELLAQHATTPDTATPNQEATR